MFRELTPAQPLPADVTVTAAALGGVQPLDLTTVNSWQDIEFLEAVHATGRRKLILCAMWTEICMAFTALDALRGGYDPPTLLAALAP